MTYVSLERRTFVCTVAFRSRIPPFKTFIRLVNKNTEQKYIKSYEDGYYLHDLGVKRLEREADHSPPSSIEVKNAWSSPPLPQYVFTAWCLVRHGNSFTFAFSTMWEKKCVAAA
jgi:hypothetical protein